MVLDEQCEAEHAPLQFRLSSGHECGGPMVTEEAAARTAATGTAVASYLRDTLTRLGGLDASPLSVTGSNPVLPAYDSLASSPAAAPAATPTAAADDEEPCTAATPHLEGSAGQTVTAGRGCAEGCSAAGDGWPLSLPKSALDASNRD